MAVPEALFALILDVVPQPVWVVDAAERIVFANPAAVSTLGYDDLAELRGKLSHQTVHYKRPDQSPYPPEECPILRPLRTGKAGHGEDQWFVRRDGSMFPIAFWCAPIELPSGPGAVLAFTDITERRATEQALRERDAAEIRTAESHAAQRRIFERMTMLRRQVARDLHNGAQQRLVSLLIGVQLAREALEVDPSYAQELLKDAAEQAQLAIDELRELAAGVHPSILTTRGLLPAVEALATRAALPVTVAGSVAERPPAAVETSIYFIVAEALTNAVKHASASHVAVTIGTDDARLMVEVRDDGVGGASLDTAGSGLAGLVDRVDALDGRLVLDSPPGVGTTLRVEIPLGPQPVERRQVGLTP